jgi:uncharacterized protein
MQNKPLNEHEMLLLDEMLLDNGNDESILSLAELDGFLTAIVSGPELILPSVWYPALWGGDANTPEWKTEQQAQVFMGLVFRHMNSIADVLMSNPEMYQAAFQIREGNEDILIVEDWCFGFMRALALKPWPDLPDEISTYLDPIRLHGLEDHFAILDTLTIEEHQQTVAEIEPAVRKLHAWWLQRRTPYDHLPPVTLSSQVRPAQVVREMEKVGRNDPCPCGSGKKFKQCCLH